LLSDEQVTANGKEQVLEALGKAATNLRGRLGESLASVQKYDAPPENVDSPWLPLVLYNLHFLEHDTAAMERQVASAMGKTGVEDQMLFLESETAAYNGEFTKSRELLRRAADAAQ
jgi:hypothetical protein